VHLLQEPALGEPHACPYLPDRRAQLAYFFARDVAAAELDTILEAGWRKFGYSFFRPSCPDCRACVPLRVPVARFAPSRSQRRVRRTASALAASFEPLEFRQEIFDVFRDHAESRFGQALVLDDFARSFYQPSCPGLQSEYRLDDALVAAGILDRSERALSSVYFAFRAAVAGYRPGVLSVLAEIAFAARLGLDYYYLGYWIAGSPRMAYKAAFRPHQLLDWQSGRWRDAEPAPDSNAVTDAVPAR
jgi:arginine-tRNA-protein transferase